MEKEGMIKIVALGVAILAIAVPIMISCMNGLANDGVVETYYADVEYEYDEETGKILSTSPDLAYDMVEYAKSRGATSWELYISMITNSYVLYKNGTIIEKVDNERNWASDNQLSAYIHEDGFGYISMYSVRAYLMNERVTYESVYGENCFAFINDGTNTTINKATWIMDDVENPEIGHYEITETLQTVKMEKLWFRNVNGNYAFGGNLRPQYINNEDIYFFASPWTSNVAMIHGNKVVIKGDGVTAQGDVNYQYTSSDDDSPVKTLTQIEISAEWDGGERTERYSGYSWDTITPIKMTYKEPYSKGMLGAVLSIIPIVVFVGIGMYVFGRLSNGGGGE